MALQPPTNPPNNRHKRASLKEAYKVSDVDFNWEKHSSRLSRDLSELGGISEQNFGPIESNESKVVGPESSERACEEAMSGESEEKESLALSEELREAEKREGEGERPKEVAQPEEREKMEEDCSGRGKKGEDEGEGQTVEPRAP